MTSSLRRAGAYAVVATFALAAPFLGQVTALPFAAVAVAAFVITDGPLFDLFAYPGDRSEGRLHRLLSFSLAATGLGLATELFGLPMGVFVASVTLLGYGDLASQVVRRWDPSEVATTTGFAVGAFLTAVVAQVVVLVAENSFALGLGPYVVFLALSGALLAALLRTVFVGRDDPLVLLSVAVLLWLFVDLSLTVTWTSIVVALAVTLVFGYLSWALNTASVAGMLTGVFLGLLTVVLGGFGWFVILITFFALGGLSTKFRYDEKVERGVAEARGGARGSGNVLGNATAALVAVVLFAASPRLPVSGELFRYAFAGSLATAMSDTFSSEIGGLYDSPRLITTFERVEPGTDGGVTWQGAVAGLVGSAVVGLLAYALMEVSLAGVGIVTLAGVLGMFADSLLGATVEGRHVGNQSVNFLATLVGAVVGGGVALFIGVTAL
ncbi:DUF92 domain-containing protein [Halobacteriaceae archaeon GCM10025711]